MPEGSRGISIIKLDGYRGKENQRKKHDQNKLYEKKINKKKDSW